MSDEWKGSEAIGFSAMPVRDLGTIDIRNVRIECAKHAPGPAMCPCCGQPCEQSLVDLLHTVTVTDSAEGGKHA